MIEQFKIVKTIAAGGEYTEIIYLEDGKLYSLLYKFGDRLCADQKPKEIL